MTEQEMVKAQASLDELTRIRDEEHHFDMRGDAVEEGIEHLRKALAALQRVRKLAVDSLRNGTAVSEGSYYSSVRSAQVLASIEDRLERDDDDEEDALDQLDSAGSTVPQGNEAAGGSHKT